MSFYGVMNQEYQLLIGEHMDPSAFYGGYYVHDFPTSDPRVTWTVEQKLVIQRGGVVRTMLDGTTRTIGMMSDLWTFALWNDSAYRYLLGQSDGLYDVDCTLVTYDSIAPGSGLEVALPVLWGRVHIPHPNELIRFNNRYFARPTLRFYDCDYAEFS